MRERGASGTLKTPRRFPFPFGAVRVGAFALKLHDVVSGHDLVAVRGAVPALKPVALGEVLRLDRWNMLPNGTGEHRHQHHSAHHCRRSPAGQAYYAVVGENAMGPRASANQSKSLSKRSPLEGACSGSAEPPKPQSIGLRGDCGANFQPPVLGADTPVPSGGYPPDECTSASAFVPSHASIHGSYMRRLRERWPQAGLRGAPHHAPDVREGEGYPVGVLHLNAT